MISPPELCREKMAAEMRALEGERADLSMETSFLKGKLKQAQDEHEACTLEADALRLRISKATQVLRARCLSDVLVAAVDLAQTQLGELGAACRLQRRWQRIRCSASAHIFYPLHRRSHRLTPHRVCAGLHADSGAPRGPDQGDRSAARCARCAE